MVARNMAIWLMWPVILPVIRQLCTVDTISIHLSEIVCPWPSRVSWLYLMESTAVHRAWPYWDPHHSLLSRPDAHSASIWLTNLATKPHSTLSHRLVMVHVPQSMLNSRAPQGLWRVPNMLPWQQEWSNPYPTSPPIQPRKCPKPSTIAAVL